MTFGACAQRSRHTSIASSLPTRPQSSISIMAPASSSASALTNACDEHPVSTRAHVLCLRSARIRRTTFTISLACRHEQAKRPIRLVSPRWSTMAQSVSRTRMSRTPMVAMREYTLAALKHGYVFDLFLGCDKIRPTETKACMMTE